MNLRALTNMAPIIPPISKLSDRIIRILGCNPGDFTLQGTNTYLLGTGANRILLDTGDKDVEEYQSNLKEVLDAENINIEHIVVTHWHHDHIGGVENIVHSLAKHCKVWKHKRSTEDEPDIKFPPSVSLNWLTNGQEIQVKGATIRVHHTPGHATDHVVLSLLEENSLFSGDCILGEGTAIFEDLYSYMKSLQKILDLQPEKIYPGHGNIVEDPIAKIQFYIAHRNQRENQILEALAKQASKPVTAMDLTMMIYTDTPESLLPAAAFNVNHHLTKLSKEKKVTLVPGEEQRWLLTPNANL